ncbi:MAG: HAMP domain-containing sensor histidine kinase [Planctomycetota bacterium]
MDLAWARRPPLPVKLLGLLAGATAAILVLALSGPWLRMRALVEDSQLETARELVETWRTLAPDARSASIADAQIDRLDLSALESSEDVFSERALRRFSDESSPREEVFDGDWDGFARRYQYGRAIRADSGELLGAVILERRSPDAAARLALNSLYLIGAGLVILAVASVLYYAIISRLVLEPVQALTDWAQAVRDGDAGARTKVSTGDEFEHLAETCDTMLDELAERERKLRAVNAAMDVKLNDLAEANETLDATSRVKGEFVANVSHELRTPLNAIIGFADLLRDMAKREIKQITDDGGDTPEILQKRVRYIDNITGGATTLLQMIEDVLEMARLEAGRVKVNIERMSIADACRGMAALIEPVAENLGVKVSLEIPEDLPLVETDPRKFQQVVFNLLSNAVKFSDPAVNRGSPGRVTIRADVVLGTDDSGNELRRVRVSVIDNGPGIAPEDQSRVFEKFQQLDGSATRVQGGTGLGLAICKELTAVLQGELRLDSEPGRGSMFSLLLPMRFDDDRFEETRLEARFRGSLAQRE